MGTGRSLPMHSPPEPLRLRFKTWEERLIEQVRGWLPGSGYGEITLKLEVHQGRVVGAARLNSEEKVRFE